MRTAAGFGSCFRLRNITGSQSLIAVVNETQNIVTGDRVNDFPELGHPCVMLLSKA